MPYGIQWMRRYTRNAMNELVTVYGSIGTSPKHEMEPTAIEIFLRTILHALPLGVCWQQCREGGDGWANESFARLAGQPGKTFAGIDALGEHLSPEDRTVYTAALTQLRTRQTNALSLELRCQSGVEDDWRELTMQAFLAADGELSALVLTLADISERKQHEKDMQRAIESAGSLNQQIEIAIDRAQQSAVEANVASAAIRQLAVLDELTGLYNRRGYNTLNPDVIQTVKDSEVRGYLCYFDLDRFKQINDELGHAKGDEALAEFSATLRANFPENALLVRLGGDEFVAMGLEHHPGEVEETLRSLENALTLRNSNGSAEFELEASAGVAFFDKTGPHSIEDLTTVADAELYKNKEKRRHARSSSRRTDTR